MFAFCFDWLMADNSAIEWTDATWNPVTGCTKISAGCDNCYAERFAERFRGVKGHPYETGFDLTRRPERLAQPLTWRRSRMIFVNVRLPADTRGSSSIQDECGKSTHHGDAEPDQLPRGDAAIVVWTVMRQGGRHRRAH
jgi:hypothetical protein